jgi:hypothetical protein
MFNQGTRQIVFHSRDIRSLQNCAMVVTRHISCRNGMFLGEVHQASLRDALWATLPEVSIADSLNPRYYLPSLRLEMPHQRTLLPSLRGKGIDTRWLLLCQATSESHRRKCPNSKDRYAVEGGVAVAVAPVNNGRPKPAGSRRFITRGSNVVVVARCAQCGRRRAAIIHTSQKIPTAL